FSEQLSIIDCNRQLPTEDLQRVLLSSAVNSARQARTKEHDPDEMFARKDTQSRGRVQLFHSRSNSINGRCRPDAMQFINNQRFAMRAYALHERPACRHAQSRRPTAPE